MNLLSRLNLAYRTLTLRDPEIIKLLGGGSTSAAGVAVSETTALNLSAVKQAVQLLAGSQASLPLHLLERVGERGKRRAREHRVYRLLHDEPNPETTSFVFRETLQAHALLWGNAYAEIERDKAARPLALWAITPDRVTVKRDAAGALSYEVKGAKKPIPAADMLHVPGLGYDGFVGYSAIAHSRESIGLGLAAEKFGARLFGASARPSGILEAKGRLNDKARARLKEEFDAYHAGVDNSHRAALLEEGVTWKAMAIPPEDAQFLETRLFQIQEIARWFNVPPHLLMDLSRGTFSNIEHQAIQFVVHSLRPWLVRWEQEIKRKLLTPAEREIFYPEHAVDGLLRGDFASRMTGYSIGRNVGLFTTNDIRDFENMNPIPAEQGGDALLVQGAMVPVSDLVKVDKEAPLPDRIEAVGQLIRAGFDPVDAAKALALPPMKHLGVLPVTVQAPPAAAPDPSDDPTDPTDPGDGGERTARLLVAHRAILADVAARMVKKEGNAARRAAGRGLAALEAWGVEFYPDFESQLAAALVPAVRAHLAAAGSDADAAVEAARIAAAHVASSREDLAAEAARGAGADVERLADRWEVERPGALGDGFLAEQLEAYTARRKAVRAAAKETAAAPPITVNVTVPERSVTITQAAQEPPTVNVPPANPTPVVVNVTPEIRALLESGRPLNVRMIDGLEELAVRLVAMPEREKVVERDASGKAGRTVEKDAA